MSLLESITPTADTLNSLNSIAAKVCGLCLVVLLAWDGIMCCVDQTRNSPTVSHVLRRANALSGGLIAMLWFGTGWYLFRGHLRGLLEW